MLILLEIKGKLHKKIKPKMDFREIDTYITVF